MISHASNFCIYVCVIYDIFIWPVVGQSAVFASRMSNARRHPNGRIHVGKYEPPRLAGVYTGSPPPPVTAIRKLMETHAFQRFDLSIVHNNSLRWLRMRGTSPTIGRDISSVNQRSLNCGWTGKSSSQMGVAWGLAAAKSGTSFGWNMPLFAPNNAPKWSQPPGRVPSNRLVYLGHP